jgi:hypothetical protein
VIFSPLLFFFCIAPVLLELGMDQRPSGRIGQKKKITEKNRTH